MILHPFTYECFIYLHLWQSSSPLHIISHRKQDDLFKIDVEQKMKGGNREQRERGWKKLEGENDVNRAFTNEKETKS